MKKVKVLIVVAMAAAVSTLAISSLFASAQIAADTGKDCTFCHTEAGSADLNDTGKCYKEKGSLEGC